MSSLTAPALAKTAARVAPSEARRDGRGESRARLLERVEEFAHHATSEHTASEHSVSEHTASKHTASATATLVVAIPAPLAPPELLLDLAASVFPGVDPESVPALVWDPPSGEVVSGLGLAHHLRADGASRFRRLRRDAEALLAEVETSSFDGLGEVSAPRLWGGFAFDVGATSEPPWTGFGDGEMILPRFLYRRRDGRAHLSLVLRADEVGDDELVRRHVDGLFALREGMARESNAPDAEADSASLAPSLGPSLGPSPGSTADPEWIRRVEEIRSAIADGEVEKIVAARRVTVAVAGDLGVSRVLRRLSPGLRSSTRFAFRREGAAFLGATPERLVTLRGRHLETEALAGSIESGDAAAAVEHAAELLGSGKDRHEQQLVTDSIVRHLSPLCAELEVASRPTVRELRDVLHLHTPIRGVLAEDRHVLELVEALHPTPAVGGVPTPAARRWIAEREGMDRGWYAAPVGWIDGEGNGEFFVALRSCVLAGGKAHLYVGAGIVADSDPEAELRETRLKAQTLLAALGA